MIGRKVLLIVAGGIAAYKAIELLRLIRKAGGGDDAFHSGAALLQAPDQVRHLEGRYAAANDEQDAPSIQHVEIP